MLSKLLTLMLLLMSLGQASLDQFVAETQLGGMLHLVNRQYPLVEGYVPDDLAEPDVLRAKSDVTMRQEAARALEALFSAAREEAGHQLMAISGYRSYDRQAAIFSRKLNDTGSRAKAQLLVAPPGTSEHQLGLAMDVGRKAVQNLHASFGESAEGLWLRDNAHRFGYIIRYQADWTDVTGYAYEPWHIRYVGREHAQRLHGLNIPLESYVDQLIAAQLALLIGEEAS